MNYILLKAFHKVSVVFLSISIVGCSGKVTSGIYDCDGCTSFKEGSVYEIKHTYFVVKQDNLKTEEMAGYILKRSGSKLGYNKYYPSSAEDWEKNKNKYNNYRIVGVLESGAKIEFKFIAFLRDWYSSKIILYLVFVESSKSSKFENLVIRYGNFKPDAL